MTIELEVANTSDVIDGITAVVDGLDPTWVKMPVPVLSLFPEATGTYPLIVQMPRETIAGEYLVTVRIESTIDPSRASTHDLWMTVEPIEAASLRLRPSVVIAGRKGGFDAIITNDGNVETQFGVSALDETRIANCTTEPLAVSVAPGQHGVVRVSARGPRPWFGQSVTRAIQVGATSPNVKLNEVATFTQKPRIPRGLLTIAILGGIVALWATIFLLVVDALRATPSPTKAVAQNFNAGGAQDVPLAAVAGTISGKVVAESTQEGIERVTVEGYRVAPDGSTDLVGSGATTSDGTYTLGALVPGSYKLRFTSDGFSEVWFPAAADEAAAGVVEVAPTDNVSGSDVVLVGQFGSIAGTITSPDSATPAVAATITIAQVGEADESESGSVTTGEPGAEPGAALAPPAPIVVQSTGDLRIDGLVTPATYRILIESPGFQTIELEETLAGGETKVLNTVRLAAADGSLTGTVRTAGGTPLGNVSVVVRSGELEKETTTPTAGNVGSFVVEELPTPRTYVITFTLEGFSSQTIALDLLAGQNLGGIEAVLVGGTGTISGLATDAAGNPLGGVDITVARGALKVSTATLTTASDIAGVGAYTIADIPTPGTYTVTFSKPGYLDETRIVRFLAPGTQAGIDASLRASQATIDGTVTDGVNPLPGVSVELNDGLTSRTTSTASSPLGSYSFSNVEPGTYTLSYQLPGYAPQIIIVKVAPGDAVGRDVAIARTG